MKLIKTMKKYLLTRKANMTKQLSLESDPTTRIYLEGYTDALQHAFNMAGTIEFNQMTYDRAEGLKKEAVK
jgi:hypothetical protein